MTQPQAVPAAPDTDEDGVPIFGRSTTAGQYDTFHLEVTPDGGEPYLETFQARKTTDAGAIMTLLSARTQLEQGHAMARLLGGILRNDDGVPTTWAPPRDPATSELLPAMDDDGYVIKDDEDRPLYRDPQGDLVADVSLLRVEHEAGSSRRRFATVMDAENLFVDFNALAELSQWVVTRAGGRPTRRQQPSSTGTARVKRSPKAAPRSRA